MWVCVGKRQWRRSDKLVETVSASVEPSGETGRTVRRQIIEKEETELNRYQNCSRYAEVLCHILEI